MGDSTAMATSGEAAPHPDDYYELLDVDRDVAAEELKRAYRRQALKWHPDKQDADNRAYAEDRFKLVSEAYQVLSDPEKRSAYDQFGKAGLEGSGMEGSGMGFDMTGFGPGLGGFGGFSSFSSFGGDNVRVVFTSSGPSGTFTRTQTSGGTHPFFQTGSDPFVLFREMFGESNFPLRSGAFQSGHDIGFGPSSRMPFYDRDDELQQALRLSREEHEQHKLEELQPDMDDDAALREAIRLSMEEQEMSA